MVDCRLQEHRNPLDALVHTRMEFLLKSTYIDIKRIPKRFHNSAFFKNLLEQIRASYPK